MVEQLPSKQNTRVRFPSPAPRPLHVDANPLKSLARSRITPHFGSEGLELVIILVVNRSRRCASWVARVPRSHRSSSNVATAGNTSFDASSRRPRRNDTAPARGHDHLSFFAAPVNGEGAAEPRKLDTPSLATRSVGPRPRFIDQQYSQGCQARLQRWSQQPARLEARFNVAAKCRFPSLGTSWLRARTLG